MTTAAKTLAEEVAREFGGRVRRDERFSGPGWPATQFTVKATHNGGPVEIGVFDAGCTFIGRGWGRDRPVFALNQQLPNMEKRVTGIAGLRVPIYRHAGTSADSVRALFADPRIVHLCSDLQLEDEEMFSVTTLSVYLVHRSTDVAKLRRRLEIIAELVPQPKPARVLTKIAHRIKVGRPVADGSVDGVRHSFGGALDRPATCDNCKAPAHLLLTIDTTDPKLRLESLGPEPIRVVFCLDCMSFPSLTYVDQSGAHPRIVQQMPEERHNETPPLEARTVELSPLKSPGGAGSKVGGLPKWIQGPDVPDCIGCKKPMAFLAQLASTRTLAYADDGVLYTFVCEACRMTASLVQSH